VFSLNSGDSPLKILFLINDAPYGTEKFYNACRLAMQVQKDHTSTDILVFLMADAVTGALLNQNTPQGYYNIERMLKSILSKGGKVKLCGGCIDARGLAQLQYIEGTIRSNMGELAAWTVEADKVFTF
jgi:uncharacterized protein involved in oxidation of intracellular sulfur